MEKCDHLVGALPFPISSTAAEFPCSLLRTSDKAGGEVQLADGLAEGAGHHSQPAEQPAQHHHKPAAKPLHQHAAEGPWKQRRKREAVREEGSILYLLDCCNYQMM